MMRALSQLLARRRLDPETSDPRLLRYSSRSFRPHRSTPIGEVRFVVLDTEATGLDLRHNRLLSLAAVAVQGGTIDLSQRVEFTFASTGVGDADTAIIHQLVRADLTDGIAEEEGILAFLEFLRDSVLVAHHVGFDVAMLKKVLGRLGPVSIYNPTLDTLRLFQRLTSSPMAGIERANVEERSLDGLCLAFGLDIPMRHSAAGDALATAQLLLALLARAQARGIRTIGSLLKT